MHLEVKNKCLSQDEIISYVRDYKQHMQTERRNRYFNILKLIPENSYGLDYGCGWGAFTVLLSEKNNRVIGQDLSKNEVEICRHVWGTSDKLEFRDTPIKSFSEKEFDFVVSNQVIEHTHNPGNYLNEINRVLKKNGKLIISLPNTMNPRYGISLLSKQLETLLINENSRILTSYKKQRDHIQAWDPIHFSRLVGTVGFKIDKFLALEGVPLPWFFSKYMLPTKIFPKKRLKNYCYTMAFKLTKVADSDIQGND